MLKTDTLGRVRTPVERREALLDEFEGSGMSGVKFAEYFGISLNPGLETADYTDCRLARSQPPLVPYAAASADSEECGSHTLYPKSGNGWQRNGPRNEPELFASEKKFTRKGSEPSLRKPVVHSLAFIPLLSSPDLGLHSLLDARNSP